MIWRDYRWPVRTLAERFWEKVHRQPEGCWLWTGYVNFFGYGKFRVASGCVSAHRLAWQLERGKIPPGLYILHHCDNPRCVNPSHLYCGTHSDNMRDMVRRGRSLRKQLQPMYKRARISLKVADKIRADRKRGLTLAQLAKRYGISWQYAGGIVAQRNRVP